MTRPWFPLAIGAATALALLFLTLPLVAVFVDTSPAWSVPFTTPAP